MQLIIEPKGFPCKLSECPPGLFLYHDEVFFKSEYSTETTSGQRPDAYCESGEYFWDGLTKAQDIKNLIVQPCKTIWMEA